MEARYRRKSGVEEQRFEDELLLQQPGVHTVLALNEAAACLWDVLRWPQSTDDLVQLLVEAWPDRDLDWARHEVRTALQPLLDHEFVVCVDR